MPPSIQPRLRAQNSLACLEHSNTFYAISRIGPKIPLANSFFGFMEWPVLLAKQASP